MDIRVQCAPGEHGEDDPQVVWFGQRELPVLAVLDRWYGREHRWWKVDTADGQYVLRREDATGVWELAAVTRTDR
ncbi:hypothetical protein [Caldimonas brevitalea]|uniref:Uncharacterized protein n=1 Tax=Caldimonas brevitalea TaxID=413882 RepID=A0A0G3BP87_9BURK|nr:hypothetical protein [Caldimonas brevitalea]AKJ28365.1 hypothetical protein AAW51_1674 [Caldimonas brevitalea]